MNLILAIAMPPDSRPIERRAGVVPKKGGFQKGHPRYGGCKKGSKNRFAVQMKDAILHAMELAGRKEKGDGGEFNKQGEGGLIGYMHHLALNNEKLFCHAFASKLLPLSLDGLLDPEKEHLSEEEVRALCKTYGIPFDGIEHPNRVCPP